MTQRMIETAAATAETIARRMPIMWWEMFTPSAEGQKEMALMVAEKQKAFVDGIVAAQAQLAREAFRLWFSPLMTPGQAANAGARVVEASLAPAGRRVRANAKRLRKKGL